MEQQFFLKHNLFLYKIQNELISSMIVKEKKWEFRPIDRWDVAYGGYDIGDEISKEEAIQYLKDHNIPESIIDKEVEYDEESVKAFREYESQMDEK